MFNWEQSDLIDNMIDFFEVFTNKIFKYQRINIKNFYWAKLLLRFTKNAKRKIILILRIHCLHS